MNPLMDAACFHPCLCTDDGSRAVGFEDDGKPIREDMCACLRSWKLHGGNLLVDGGDTQVWIVILSIKNSNYSLQVDAISGCTFLEWRLNFSRFCVRPQMVVRPNRYTIIGGGPSGPMSCLFRKTAVWRMSPAC